MKRKGFTLVEILITLAIIGTVAALSIPTVIQNVQKEEFKVKLQSAYSIISQGYLKMLSDSYQRNDFIGIPNSFKPVFMKYFNVVKDCGTNNCVNSENNPYKTYNKAFPATTGHFENGQFILNNGMLILIDNAANLWILVSVDINGLNNGPNTIGYDVFTFTISDYIIKPLSFNDTGYWTQATTCSLNKFNGSGDNGFSCTASALTDKSYWNNLP